MYQIALSEIADMDIDYWKKSGQKNIQNKISQLLKDIQEHPYTGLGKPEALRYNLSGKYSRRINQEHRIVYEVDEIQQLVIIHSLKGHY